MPRRRNQPRQAPETPPVLPFAMKAEFTTSPYFPKDIRSCAEVKIGDICTVRNVKIRENDYGLYVEMPRIKTSEDSHIDAVLFRDKAMRDVFDAAVLGQYNNDTPLAAFTPIQLDDDLDNDGPDAERQEQAAAASMQAHAVIIPGEPGSAGTRAEVTVNDWFSVRGVKILPGDYGDVAQMPRVKPLDSHVSTTGYRDAVFFDSKELRQVFDKAALDAWQQHQEMRQAAGPEQAAPQEAGEQAAPAMEQTM